MKRLHKIIPFIILSILLGLLWKELFYASPGTLPSALLGEAIPTFSVPELYQPKYSFTEKNLTGRVVLLNIWASWCDACALEQPMLMKIKEQYHIPIYSLNYKDGPKAAKQWLKRYGNPYILIGSDTKGEVAIDLGVYGTPETFVINAQGKIIYRHVGAIDQTTWEKTLFPLIKAGTQP